MNIDGTAYRTIWLGDDGATVEVIDQTQLPHRFDVAKLTSLEDTSHAIRDMLVRGAPLIGATAAYGMALAMREDSTDSGLANAHAMLMAARPTAINLRWALDDMLLRLESQPTDVRVGIAYERAAQVCDEDVAINSAIGDHGFEVIREFYEARGGNSPINILTHCNAGWLATVDWGTALAPVYKAHDAGIPVHVWADETRPRNQGAALTAWELERHGVSYGVVADNAGGHMMQQGLVDLCITGTDRTAASGDVANKIGTYLKALAADDNDVPFYVGLPSPTIDWTIMDGVRDIPIEKRDQEEVTHISGKTAEGSITKVQLTPDGAKAVNYAFDVTPARLVTGLITERGVCAASRDGLAGLFPERATPASEVLRRRRRR
ncbi:MAG: S-methyl-5-thioribose-1-phosphate isomerase [Alphaproteobacteria bacterium]|nr:S-methyl-5-thioribose-1-phosphate isomerase [Alphaproteobacteria bacterium]HCP00045.1 S-methyl-5-thioribose-1-phosphate isomerase [Rhodospirillaceae bacterium]